MYDNDLDVIFLNATLMAMRNGCKKTKIADQLNYSESRFAQKIKGITGLNYKLLDDLIWGSVVWSCVKKHKKIKMQHVSYVSQKRTLASILKDTPRSLLKL